MVIKDDDGKSEQVSFEEIKQVLGLTIKGDDDNKLITFLCMLSAYTDSSQFNISFNAPSSTGKSYIPLEVYRLFPKEDTIVLGHCSPAAFFHDQTSFDAKMGMGTVDLERKILIFLDQPHNDLLQRLRPLLSHDKKELSIKIADKTNKFGLKTKNITVIGYPAVVFCSAGLELDEQEATRFILLNPDMDQEKLRASIHEKIKKEGDVKRYLSELENNPKRKKIMELIKEIKDVYITEIIIDDQDRIRKYFQDRNKFFKARHMRDIGKVMAFIKASAILNYKHRKREGTVVWADNYDIEQAFSLWDRVSPSQELNLSPYVYSIYEDIVKPLCKDGLDTTKEDIQRVYFERYRSPLAGWKLGQEILPALKATGLIIMEPDPGDKRRIRIYLS